MIVWLDHLIFGNGRGFGSPYFDQRFYWLRGEFYTWIGGFGAQLQSVQWTHPKPGERRRIAGDDYTPFCSARRWGRVRVSWSTRLPSDINAARAKLTEIKAKLGDHWTR